MTKNIISNTALRMNLDNYPYKATQPIRWTDVGANGMLSFVGLGGCFEEARMGFASNSYTVDTASNSNLSVNWRGFIVRYRVNVFSLINMESPLTYGLGIIGIGRSSYTIAIGVFQQGECVSLCENTAVLVGDDNRPREMSDNERARLESCQMTLQEKITPPVRALPAQLEHENYAHFEYFSPRFCDTDRLGHINNVAISGYYENELMCFLKSAGLEQVQRQQLFESVGCSDIAYLGEGLFGETIRACTSVTKINDQAITLHQALFQSEQCIGVRILQLRPEALTIAPKKFEDMLLNSQLAQRLSKG